jgi:hypothetical protein
MKKIGLLCLALVLALGTLGVSYAMWDKYIYIDTTVNTGEVNAEFVSAFTDDDGTVDDATKDDGDDGGGTDYDYWGPDSSDDPKEVGPNPARWNKDVGRCYAEIDGSDPQIIHFYVQNGYPYYCNTLWFEIENTGTVPVNIEGLTITPVGDIDRDNDGYDDITVALSELSDGLQIDPYSWASETQWGNVEICVVQTLNDDADGVGGENEVYEFTVSIWLVQWNEPQP